MMFIFFCGLLALAKATPEYQSPSYVSTGTSQQYRTQDVSGNYRFGYDESHPSGGTFRDETGDAWGNKYGSYGLREADGRYRVVNYVADAQGFRADIKSNEPGVAPKDPASATIKKPVLYSAPVAAAPVAPAPVAPVISFTAHHSYNPDYPLLYRNPYYVPYNTYKGTPYRRYNPYYKGSSFSRKGAPFVAQQAYYIYP